MFMLLVNIELKNNTLLTFVMISEMDKYKDKYWGVREVCREISTKLKLIISITFFYLIYKVFTTIL